MISKITQSVFGFRKRFFILMSEFKLNPNHSLFTKHFISLYKKKSLLKPGKNIIFYILSLIYGGLTTIRNCFFDWGILKQHSFDLPVISIGNLAVGGTGKTPHTEFLIRLLSEKFRTAVLSRGYRRKTTNFVLADTNSTAQSIGDEPFQIFSKFQNVTVAVDEKRVRGIQNLLKIHPDVQVIILDDGFQHRPIKPGLSILLTDYTNLYADDYMLPYGTLREYKTNSKRTDMVVVTKCPEEIQPDECKSIAAKLALKSHQQLFFSTFEYRQIYPVFPEVIRKPVAEITSETAVLLVTGIVKPQPILDWLKKKTQKVKTRFYPDHHDFDKKDISEIEKDFIDIQGDKLILTTEKDAARLKSNPDLTEKIMKSLYALPLEVKILNNEQDIFIQKIQDYVRKNSGNC